MVLDPNTPPPPPNLCPFIKTTPLVQSFICKNVCFGSMWILNVALNNWGVDSLFHSVTFFQERELFLKLIENDNNNQLQLLRAFLAKFVYH